MLCGRPLIHTVALACIAAVVGTSVAFADIIDDCGDLEYHEYVNFSAALTSSLGWSGVSDDTLLVQGSDNVSYATYTCSGVSSVELVLYSRLPAFAAVTSEGALLRSVSAEGERLPLLYSPSLDTVYASYGGALYAGEYDPQTALYCFPGTSADPGDLTAYGASVSYLDGGYTEVPLTLSEVRDCGKCVMQTYVADIPQGAAAVRVTLTEQYRVALTGRSAAHTIKNKGTLALGSVTLYGAQPEAQALTMTDAAPAAAVPFEEPDAYDEYYAQTAPDMAEIEQELSSREETAEEPPVPEPQPEAASTGQPAGQPAEAEPATQKAQQEPQQAPQPAEPSAEPHAAAAAYAAASEEAVRGFGGFFSTVEWSGANTVTIVLISALGVLGALRILLGGRRM